MKNKIWHRKTLILTLIIILTVSMAGLTGCGSKKQAVTLLDDTGSKSLETDESKDTTTAESQDLSAGSLDEQSTAINTAEDTGKNQDNSSENTEDANTESDNTGKSDDNAGKEKNLTQLTGLLGLTKEEVGKETGEEPSSIDEGGLEFKNYGIRVWFDADSKVNQIFLLNNDIDLNGVKAGDKISAFKEVFGDPVKDNNGDAHFKFGDIYLSVNYDTSTLETYGVYILSEDF